MKGPFPLGSNPVIRLENGYIMRWGNDRYLGLQLDEKCSFQEYIGKACIEAKEMKHTIANMTQRQYKMPLIAV